LNVLRTTGCGTILGSLEFMIFNKNTGVAVKNISQSDIDNIIEKIKNTYELNKNEIDNNDYYFLEFLYIYFDNDFVNLFMQLTEYTDWKYASVNSVIEQYPINELIVKTGKIHILKGGWNTLRDKLLEKVKNIQLNTEIIKIIKNNDTFIITDKNNKIYNCKRIVISGDITVKNIIFENIIGIEKFLSQFGSVSFLRIYTYHDNIENFTKSIKTTNLLSKIIKISKNVLLSCYTDNEYAKILFGIYNKQTPDEFKKTLYKMILQSLPSNYVVSKIKDMYVKYWINGVHYYNTCKTISQNKLIEQGIGFCGEMVSDNQGWIDGAISSVDKFKII